MPPARITIRSPGFTSVIFVSISVPFACSQTLSTRRLMAEARSATDFLRVHSSKISPSPSMNMTEPAVEKSPLVMDTVMAVASNTATDNLPWRSAKNPSLMYFTERNNASADVIGAGRNSLETHRLMRVMASLSSNSRFSSREVCSGTSSMPSALAKEKDASAAMTSPRVPLYTTTASWVRS